MPKYGFFSGPYFSVFSPITGKYGPEETPYLEIFHAVSTLHLTVIYSIILGPIAIIFTLTSKVQ